MSASARAYLSFLLVGMLFIACQSRPAGMTDPGGRWSDSEARQRLRPVRMRSSESRTTSNSMILVPL